MRQFPAERFEGFLSAMISEHQIPGVAVSVMADGEVIYAKGFGSRDSAKGLPVTPETIFGVASITKSFTSLAAVQLAEAGKLSLDDPIKKYLPGFDVPGGGGDAITIHHFLTHTSGLPPLPALDYSIMGNTPGRSDDGGDETPGEGGKEELPRIDTTEELLDFLKNGNFRMLGRPGEYCSYSNDGFALMGPIIEKASGRPYEEYVRERILEPLEMGRSVFGAEEALAKGNATSLYYRDDDDQVVCTPHWSVAPPFVACGWLKSTVLDLANYVSMYAAGGTFRGRRLVSPEGLARMTTGHHTYSRDRWYGYGLGILPGYGGGTLVEHSGGLRGVSSNMGFVREKGAGAAVLCNLAGAPAGKIWLAAMNLMLGLPVEHPRSAYEQGDWPAGSLARFTGRFRSGEGGEALFTADGGHLYVTVAKKKYRVRRDREDYGVAFMNGQPSEIRFYFGDDGNVRAVGYGGRVITKTAAG